MNTRRIASTLLVFLLAGGLLSALTPEEILDRVEENQTFSTFRGEGKMVITDRFGTRTKTFRFYAKGEEQSLIEFTSIDEAGQKILRTEDEIYLYYPDAEELIRLQGAALRESVAGSDLSYEDLTGGKELKDKYRVSIEGEETANGRPCYVLVLEAKVKDVAYPRQKLWVDKELFVGWKAQYFALSGKVLKEVEVKEIEEIKGHSIPVHYVFRDMLKRNSSTEFLISGIEVDIPLDERIFSLEELTW
ncbi:outer membrane protein involved in lipoprotein sorting [Spirochaeta thermophila DSM 6578]|uniref:Outer membrane protein involved in lipoprotein sorting n=1 Tax=Winmispira thermophila (strain ATCC 700085 / DSM 6578 / Z-1203) TaxID=869211 RepID=G0GCQ8_WINT7|nr:outer membrane lipoprotein-sorting protein [Spirochaeta thermophila]AEJ60477.1 outer membrane protein involved in lipoprotein sorting [Spirochaeta thermophila DSM 6578]